MAPATRISIITWDCPHFHHHHNIIYPAKSRRFVPAKVALPLRARIHGRVKATNRFRKRLLLFPEFAFVRRPNEEVPDPHEIGRSIAINRGRCVEQAQQLQSTSSHGIVKLLRKDDRELITVVIDGLAQRVGLNGGELVLVGRLAHALVHFAMRLLGLT
jgi:hypothetical protein